ncbi:hypothetical protein [Streptomyces clavifer]
MQLGDGVGLRSLGEGDVREQTGVSRIGQWANTRGPPGVCGGHAKIEERGTAADVHAAVVGVGARH